jgi:hypothetical protein
VNSHLPDHYATLGVKASASDAEIKRAYRRRMRAVHPDANVDDPQATRKAAALNLAFETIGDPEKRRAYDAQRAAQRAAQRSPSTRASRRQYEAWAEQPDWEDIVAENVPPARPPHVHTPAPIFEPDEVEVSMTELREQPRVRRTLRLVNHCNCTLVGDVSTSEPWVWGPVGRITIGPGVTAAFDVEVVASKVSFPGLSRITFVAKEWTGVVPVKVTGFEAKRRRPPATPSQYVPPRRRRAVRTR